MGDLPVVTVDIYGAGDKNMLRFGAALDVLGVAAIVCGVILPPPPRDSKDSPVGAMLIAIGSLVLILGVATSWFVYLSKKRDKALGAIRLFDDALRSAREETVKSMEMQATQAATVRDQFKGVLDGFESNIRLAGENAQHIASLISSAEFLDRTLADASKLVADQQAVLEQTKRNKEQEMEKMILRQESAENRRRVEKWEQSAVNVFAALERSLAFSKDESYRQACINMFEQMSAEARTNNLEVIAPRPGDSFNQDLHQIIEEVESHSYQARAVVDCLSWGYRSGDQIKRRADVRVVRGMR